MAEFSMIKKKAELKVRLFLKVTYENISVENGNAAKTKAKIR